MSHLRLEGKVMRILVIALSVLLVAGALGQDGDKAPKKRAMKDRVWAEGKIVCIGCSLAAEYGVDAQCTLHAKHAQGFLGKDSKLWTLVDSNRGHRVITNAKLLHKDVKVYGWFFKKHQYLELWKYSLKKGDQWIGYDFCKT